jgi:hypothetical protein
MLSTFGCLAVKLRDDVWQVMKTYLHDRMGFDAPPEARDWMEKNLDITPFDGGVFIAKDNEFDLFVVPEKRGKWRIREEITKYLDTMAKAHDTIVVKIYDDNDASLRLARFFGFNEVSRDNGMVRLEKKYG